MKIRPSNLFLISKNKVGTIHYLCPTLFRQATISADPYLGNLGFGITDCVFKGAFGGISSGKTDTVSSACLPHSNVGIVSIKIQTALTTNKLGVLGIFGNVTAVNKAV